MSNIFINSFGLILDIIGGILIFKFGLPEGITKGGQDIVTYDPSPELIKKSKKFIFWSRLGFISLILGFLLQLISNFLIDV